ncbi:MAG: sodium:calcium antiporter [Desulfarculus sp.]|nr:sodium:calcium antiporter [Pseudomonadota bacterium]MBV1715086.1 sodium:calcium antiporter [Desulfarculus sp.]MBU4576411.1 sodium:calcium antiporter [Pseudomonadota bacterium]MBU4596301.1 sodium:calcium antiporter [Pseudomonadota bacterium]MBV1739234.1 sodium:calcium antiporter [Desulfarculus sp.]
MYDIEAILNNLANQTPTWLLFVIIALCLALLSKSADKMIDGAVSLARRTRLPKIVIGATIISLGTTVPETVVSVLAAWSGHSGLALGNGVGSIICDTALIFGLMCLLAKIPVRKFILNRTGWMQVGAATLLVIMALLALWIAPDKPMLGRSVGVLFIALLALYMYLSYRWARQSGQADFEEEDEGEDWSTLKSVLFLLGGLAGVIVASRVLIPCAVVGACRLGVPQDVVAATIVAFGTSVPELMTGISSIRKGHPQIMVGNVVGADVLNCLFVIGAAALTEPLHIPDNFYYFHFPAMLAILYSFRVIIFMNRDGWFKRWQGAWLLGLYALYLTLQYSLNITGAEG